MEIRTLSIAVMPDNARIFDQNTTTISIEDDAAGEYVEVAQCDDGVEPGVIKIDPTEWPAMRDSISRMIAQCRKDKEQ